MPSPHRTLLPSSHQLADKRDAMPLPASPVKPGCSSGWSDSSGPSDQEPSSVAAGGCSSRRVRAAHRAQVSLQAPPPWCRAQAAGRCWVVVRCASWQRVRPPAPLLQVSPTPPTPPLRHCPPLLLQELLRELQGQDHQGTPPCRCRPALSNAHLAQLCSAMAAVFLAILVGRLVLQA